MKLCFVKFVCILDYNELFFGDLIWVIEFIGGIIEEGVLFVMKNLFCFLYILDNLGFVLELNLIVFWFIYLLLGFKKFCVKMFIKIFVI